MGDKRKDYISWDEYFMGIATLSGMRSKDPNTQVGACIVSQDNKILSMGYNGLPRGCSDDEFPWKKCYIKLGIIKASASVIKNRIKLTMSCIEILIIFTISVPWKLII